MCADYSAFGPKAGQVALVAQPVRLSACATSTAVVAITVHRAVAGVIGTEPDRLPIDHHVHSTVCMFDLG